MHENLSIDLEVTWIFLEFKAIRNMTTSPSINKILLHFMSQEKNIERNFTWMATLNEKAASQYQYGSLYDENK